MMLSKKQLQGADLGVLPGVPIGSMYSIYTYMTGVIFMVYVGKCIIYGSYGVGEM